MCRGLIIVGSDEAVWATLNPAKKSFSICPLSVVLCESLNSIRTYVRYVCECDHRLPPAPGRASRCLQLPGFQAWNQAWAKRG
jgi:hypothetical protein